MSIRFKLPPALFSHPLAAAMRHDRVMIAIAPASWPGSCLDHVPMRVLQLRESKDEPSSALHGEPTGRCHRYPANIELP